MIASVQIMSGARVLGIPKATPPNVSSSPTFQSVMGKYQSADQADSDESPTVDSKNYASQNSADTAARAAHPRQQPAAKAVTQAADESAPVVHDQETDTPAYAEEAQAHRTSRFHNFLRKLHSADSKEPQADASVAAPKNTNIGTAVVPPIPLHAAEPLRTVLPLTAVLTLRQSGNASQDSPAAPSESAAATEEAPPIPLSTPQIQAEDTTASGSLAFAARLTANMDAASAKAGGAPPAAQALAPEATDNAAQSQTKSAAEASSLTAAKQLLSSGEAQGTTGDASNTRGGDSSPHQNPSDLFGQNAAAFMESAPARMQAQAEKPATTDSASQTLSAAAHLDKTIDPPAASPSANHDITVHIPDAADQSTAVRFVERGGEVHVSVRSTDSEMAQTLRGGLNELVNRLQDGGIQTEVWQPGSDAFTSRDGQQHQFTNPDGSNGHSSGSHSQQESSQQQKPRWLEELENSVGDLKETPQLWQA